MTSDRLFGNDIKPACKYCAEAFQQMEEQVLCMKRGIVQPDYSCKKFVYDPLKRVPPRPRILETFDSEDFDA